MTLTLSEKNPQLGPYRPTVILHGGAGALSPANVPPELWAQYRASLLKYLTQTRKLLDAGATALDAATYAVTLFEDDPLFNCGRGAVFTDKGTIELEASVMVTSLNPDGPPAGAIKRAAAVSLVKNTQHPILLAKELLIASDEDGGLGGTSTMHSHLSGRELEEWGWNDRGLQKKSDSWFWTRKRWEEHRRGLRPKSTSLDAYTFDDLLASADPLARLSREGADLDIDVLEIPSQGTVGAVALDSWGNLATATSTGGLTNKKPGRIGDTPTIGSGFWADAWSEEVPVSALSRNEVLLETRSLLRHTSDLLWEHSKAMIGSCMDPLLRPPQYTHGYLNLNDHPPSYEAVVRSSSSAEQYKSPEPATLSTRPTRRRAVALSGTGNGDSFLRTNAVRTAASISRFQAHQVPLEKAVLAIAGPNGELQLSAGDRWGRTGEGQGGIIGIEVTDDVVVEQVDNNNGAATTLQSKRSAFTKKGTPVFAFNCGGLFRAYYKAAAHDSLAEEKPVVAVFPGDD